MLCSWNLIRGEKGLRSLNLKFENKAEQNCRPCRGERGLVGLGLRLIAPLFDSPSACLDCLLFLWTAVLPREGHQVDSKALRAELEVTRYTRQTKEA